MKLWDNYIRWLYRGGRPGGFARAQNRVSAILFGAGVGPDSWSALEVRGRRSGRARSFPVAVADYQGERYLVAMLGEGTNWVHNLRAADGRAVLRHGRREQVKLEEVPVERRPPIIKRYLAVAPGARPHIRVDARAALSEFERVAPRIPVFRVMAGRADSDWH